MKLQDLDLRGEVDAKKLVPIYIELQRALAEGRTEEYSEFLKSLNVEELEITPMMGVSRLSFMWRDSIPHWKEYVAKIRDEIERRGEDAEKILTGLLSRLD